MAQTSTLFLRNITCLDHAVITKDGRIEGGSYHVSVEVTGPVEEGEQVVVDFSRIKGELKKAIDDKEFGYDHKLWVMPMSFYPNTDMLIGEDPTYDNGVWIDTIVFRIRVPNNAVRMIDDLDVASDIGRYLEQVLKGIHGINLKCKVDLSLSGFTSKNSAQYFTYWHGLKNSSSWGCKNIGHGHRSFVEVQTTGLPDGGSQLTRNIAKWLNGTMFIHKDNLKVISENEWEVAYFTERGYFNLSFDPKDVKHIIMDKETTIENIIEYVWSRLEFQRSVVQIDSLFISEGLQKGARISA